MNGMRVQLRDLLWLEEWGGGGDCFHLVCFKVLLFIYIYIVIHNDIFCI